MTAKARAQALATRRAELLARLPHKLADARSLSDVDRELVVDDAISYTVLKYPGPVEQPADLERVFWTACDFRVKKAVVGRSETVRAGFHRASEEALAGLVDVSDPAAAVEAAEAAGLVREYAETLPELERRVLRVKYFSGTAEPLGYKAIAQRLGISQATARAADRSIKRSLEHFAAIYTAGRLCDTREPAITALATGSADRRQARIARAHIAHCLHCHATYAEQLRVIRSTAFERKVAALLPVAEVQDRGRARGAWDAIADCVTRPFGHDTTATAAQLAASGAGRGAGTIAVLKIAGACMASATAVGVCATTFVAPVFTEDPRPAKAVPKPAKREVERPAGSHERIPSRAEQHLIPTPTPTPKPNPAKRAASRRDSASASKTQGGTGPTDHEDTPATPAPSNAAPNGASEFDPNYKPSEPPQPAPVPAAPGSTEFF